MNGVKLGIVVVVAIIAGSLGGGMFMRQRLHESLTQMINELNQAKTAMAKESEARKQAEQRVIDLEATLKSRDQALRDAQAALVKLASEQSAAAEAVPAAAPVEETPPPAEDNQSRRRRGASGDFGPRGGPGDPNGDPQQNGGPGDRANFAQRMQERVQGFLQTEASKTTDPAVQQRLASLSDQSTYMMDLMERIRETENEDERAQLQQELQQVRGTVSQLVNEQQDYMLRQVATQSGVTDPEKLQSFMNGLHEVQASPIFRMQGGFGGPGGGPGGR